MVRVYNPTAQLYLLMLLYMRDVVEVDPDDLIHYFQTRYKGSTRLNRGMTEVVHRMAQEMHAQGYKGGYDQMVTEMTQQLFAKPDSHEGNLVDTVVEVLGMEWGRNRLTQRHFDSLRKAILIPEELRDLREKLKKGETACPECHHTFNDGELVTLTHDQGGSVIHCARCRTPVVVKCSKDIACEEAAGIDNNKLYDLVVKAICHTHSEKDPKEVPKDGSAVGDIVNRAREFAVGNARSRRQDARRRVNRGFGQTQWAPAPIPPPTAAPPAANDTPRWSTLDEIISAAEARGIQPQTATFTPSTITLDIETPAATNAEMDLDPLPDNPFDDGDEEV